MTCKISEKKNSLDWNCSILPSALPISSHLYYHALPISSHLSSPPLCSVLSISSRLSYPILPIFSHLSSTPLSSLSPLTCPILSLSYLSCPAGVPQTTEYYQLPTEAVPAGCLATAATSASSDQKERQGPQKSYQGLVLNVINAFLFSLFVRCIANDIGSPCLFSITGMKQSTRRPARSMVYSWVWSNYCIASN